MQQGSKHLEKSSAGALHLGYRLSYRLCLAIKIDVKGMFALQTRSVYPPSTSHTEAGGLFAHMLGRRLNIQLERFKFPNFQEFLARASKLSVREFQLGISNSGNLNSNLKNNENSLFCLRTTTL